MKLSTLEIEGHLKKLSNWSLQNNAIEKKYTFKDFKQAMAFINKAANFAETMNHHPEWTNVYNKLTIRLSTHDVSGISNKDFQLAAAIDTIIV